VSWMGLPGRAIAAMDEEELYHGGSPSVRLSGRPPVR
jgi:hypothetical protein